MSGSSTDVASGRGVNSNGEIYGFATCIRIMLVRSVAIQRGNSELNFQLLPVPDGLLSSLGKKGSSRKFPRAVQSVFLEVSSHLSGVWHLDLGSLREEG